MEFMKIYKSGRSGFLAKKLSTVSLALSTLKGFITIFDVDSVQ